jgi:CubicO group peptidase (beta-lactamase class C family)
VVGANGELTTEPAQQPIFIQDLMRHTSGLTYGGRGTTPVHKLFPAASATAAVAMTGPEFIDTLSKLPLLYQPGTTWDYGLSIDVLGSVGDYTWNGANGTIFWVDPQEKLVVVMMSAAPGEIRKYYREQMSALVYGAMER